MQALDKSKSDRYRSNILVSYCLFAITFTNPPTDVVPQLLDYFARSGTRGTTETQRMLAQALVHRSR